MPNASIKLPNGTSIVIEGSPEDIAQVLALYGGTSEQMDRRKDTVQRPIPKKAGKAKAKPRETGEETNATGNDSTNLTKIIEEIKNCEWAERIESEILDKSAQVNRILLPLFVIHEYFENSIALTSGDIGRITKDLGIPIHIANVSNTLSGTASKYVIGDGVRKKGQPVKYKLSRRGVQYFKALLEGKPDDK
jgi:hypothetical protein